MTHTIKSHAENERWETLRNCEICFPATAPLHNRIATLEAENARLTADAKLNDMAWNDNQAALKQIVTAIEDVKIYCNNPSAWDYYDETVSQKIRAILKAAGMA